MAYHRNGSELPHLRAQESLALRVVGPGLLCEIERAASNGLEDDVAVSPLWPARDYQNGNRAIGHDLFHGGQTVDPRHLQIDDDQVRIVPFEKLQHRSAVARFSDDLDIPVLLQN